MKVLVLSTLTVFNPERKKYSIEFTVETSATEDLLDEMIFELRTDIKRTARDVFLSIIVPTQWSPTGGEFTSRISAKDLGIPMVCFHGVDPVFVVGQATILP